MATKKFYLSAQAADVTFGTTAAWDDATTSAGLSALTDAPAGANVAHTAAETSPLAGYRVMLHRWVSPPVERAGTIAPHASNGMFEFTAAFLASHNNSARPAITAFVLTPQGTVRGTLVNLNWSANITSTLTGRTLIAPGASSTPVAVQPGDRVVFEVGYATVNTVTASRTGTIRGGGTASTDLAAADTGTNALTRPGHVTFLGDVSDLWEPAAAVEFVDTFDGTTPDLTWTPARGSAVPATNGDGTASIAGTGWRYVRADHDVESTDMFTQVHVTDDGSTGDRQIVLFLRAVEATQGTQAAETYVSAVLRYETGTLSFLNWAGPGAPVGGGPIDGDVAVTIPAVPFTFRFEAEGDQLRGYLNDTLVKTTTLAGGPSGTRGGLGAGGGATSAAIRFGEYRVGALGEDPGPGPGPGPGGGVPAVIETYTDAHTSGGTATLAVAVPAVAEGQGLLAIVTSIYNGDDMTPSGGGAWDPVGAQLGDGGGEANQRVAAFIAAPTGPATLRTVTVDVTNEASLTVLHLDAVPTVEDSSDHIVPRNVGPDGVQTVGPVDVPAGGGLVVGVWAGVQFDGTIGWVPDEPEAVVRAQRDMGGWTGYLVTTEEVEVGPVVRTATATAEPGPSAGFAGKLIVLSGEGGEPEPPDSDEAAVRFGWGAPLPASDEFDTPGLPDPVRWSTYGYDHDANGGAGAHGTWPNPHGNGFRNSQNATVITEGGETFLRLRGDANGDQGAVASRFDQQYGRWEIRARFDRDAATGTRPMNALGIIWPESEVWPEDGEYDFLETPSGAAQAQAWIHYPHQVHPNNAQEQAIHPGGIDLTEWHNYGFEWDTDGVRCWVDGEFWYEFSGIGPGASPPGAGEDFRVAPIQDMPSGHLTLQYDNFATGTGGDTPQAGTYDIAWARIYPPAARQIGPGAFAGRDRAVGVGDTVTVTGYAGAAATGHAWSIVSGPDRHGETVATTAVAEFTPTLPGTYVLQYAATGGGTSTDRIKVRALPEPESTVRVNLALNPQFGAVPGSGPAMWWGGEQVTVTGVDGVTTGLEADEGECATGRFLVSDSNWHDGDDRITVSVVVIAESATTVTCGVDFYTAVDGGSFIPDGARVSNSTSVECPAGVPTRIVIRDQPRDPGAPPNPVTGEPHPYSLRQPMIVPSNAVTGLVTARSTDGVPFVITALMPEAGVDAPTGSPGPGGGQ